VRGREEKENEEEDERNNRLFSKVLSLKSSF
jgi:hypothetical protein